MALQHSEGEQDQGQPPPLPHGVCLWSTKGSGTWKDLAGFSVDVHELV